jgi:hypothetical protein
MVIFIGGIAVCLLNLNTLKKPVFQKKTNFYVASVAKYEKYGAQGDILFFDMTSSICFNGDASRRFF